jgi:hypothetical protein
MSEEKRGLQPHPIVARLASDPAAPREVAQFCGYIGKSTRGDHHRLYTSLELDEYIDIPHAAVVHHEDIPDTEMQHGGTRVWVDACAEVIHEVRHTTRTEARFLEGNIADEYLSDETAGGEFERPYTPYCQTREPDCTGNSCATCFRCPQQEDGANFGTPGTFRTCGQTCFIRTCVVTCVATCAATCRLTCRATCLRTCMATCRATCLATCGATCVRTCNTCGIACTLRCPITRQACPQTQFCPRTQICPQTLVCPVTNVCPITRGACPLPTRACPTGAVCTGPQIPEIDPIDVAGDFGSAAPHPGYGYGYNPYQGWWYGSGDDPWGRGW